VLEVAIAWFPLIYHHLSKWVHGNHGFILTVKDCYSQNIGTMLATLMILKV